MQQLNSRMGLGGVSLFLLLLLCTAFSLAQYATTAIDFTPLPELDGEPQPPLESSPGGGYYFLPHSLVDAVIPSPLPYGQLSEQ